MSNSDEVRQSRRSQCRGRPVHVSDGVTAVDDADALDVRDEERRERDNAQCDCESGHEIYFAPARWRSMAWSSSIRDSLAIECGRSRSLKLRNSSREGSNTFAS